MTDEAHMVTWGSHTPLHLALIETYDIQGTIEYGAGVHSTQMFFNNVPNVISIETDSTWVEYVKNNVKEDSTHCIKHLDLSSYFPEGRKARAVRNHEMPNSYFDVARDEILFLGEYRQSDHQYEHMFVDSISSLRHCILHTFYSMHSIITFHDVNPLGMKNHWKNKLSAPEGYTMFVDSTYSRQHTGLWLANEKLDKIDELTKNLKKHIKAYTDISPPMKFVRIEDGHM